MRRHGGDGGATAVLVRYHGGHGGTTAVPLRSWRCRGDPTADWPTPRWPAEVVNMFKVSAVPPRRSAILTVFCGATAITDGTTAIMAVPVRFMPYKHRRSTAPPV